MTRTKSYGLHGHTVCVFATESPPIRLVRLKREDLMCIHKALRTLTNRWNYIGMTTAQFGVGKSNSHWNSLPLEDVSHSLWENISQTDPPVNFALKCSIRPGVSLNLQLTPYRMLYNLAQPNRKLLSIRTDYQKTCRSNSSQQLF
jgi:hypothetical protein